jgi:hypothetical protein
MGGVASKKPLLPSPCSLNPLPLPSGVALLIFRQAKSLPSSKLKFQMFFGQLQSIVATPIPKSKELKTKKPKNVCLAVI